MSPVTMDTPASFASSAIEETMLLKGVKGSKEKMEKAFFSAVEQPDRTDQLDHKDCRGSLIVNLASKEYSKCVEKYLTPEDRYMAENDVRDAEGIKGFDRLGYRYEEAFSDEGEYIFLKKEQDGDCHGYKKCI